MTFLWILLSISLLVSAVGWIYFIYFFSIGYGLSIAALAVATGIIFHSTLSLPAAIMCGVFLLYGLRLSLFLLHRERRSASYKKILYQPDNTTRKPLLAMFMIWISCALLYVGQISPITFYLYNAAHGAVVNETILWIATAIVAFGVIIEIIADAEKSAAKKRDAGRFVSHGLYRIVRCPNYLGEIVMWSGCFVLCFGSCCTVGQWIIASLGYACILYVMFSGARRLELRQAETYGTNPEFQAYIKRTPLILPLAPIYTLARHSWLKA